jgi:hypothetical protein
LSRRTIYLPGAAVTADLAGSENIAFPDPQPLATKRRKRIYPEPIEREMGQLQQWPGDVFSDPDTRPVKRRKRIYQDAVFGDFGGPTLYPGDVFTDPDLRQMHVRKRVRQPWQDDLSTFDCSSSMAPDAYYCQPVAAPTFGCQINAVPTYNANLSVSPGT